MKKPPSQELEEIEFPSLAPQGSTVYRIASSRLETGMFVVELGQAFLGTPFPKSGVYLNDPHQAAAMRARSESALIDIERSDPGRATAIRIAAQLYGEGEHDSQRAALTPVAFRRAPERFGPARMSTTGPSETPKNVAYTRINEPLAADRSNTTEMWSAPRPSAIEQSLAPAPAARRESARPSRRAEPPEPPAGWADTQQEEEAERAAPATAPVIADYAPIGGADAPSKLRSDLRISRTRRSELRQMLAGEGRGVTVSAGNQGVLSRLASWLSGPKARPEVGAQSMERLRVRFGPTIRSCRYDTECTIIEAMARARDTYARLLGAHATALRAARGQESLPWHELEPALFGLAESVIEHPDALLWCDRMHEQRSLGNRPPATPAVLMAGFARHLGLPREEIMVFAAIGMCLDLGKARLPRDLVNVAGRFDRKQFDRMKEHVGESVELLESSPGVPDAVIRGVAEHHERYDGSGYPEGRKGDEIGLHGAAAAIVDCYTALISARSYANPVSPEDALNALMGWADRSLDGPLMEQFALATGLFPVGSAVELASGGLGLVIEIDRANQDEHRVLVLTGPNGRPLPKRPRDAARNRRGQPTEPEVEILEGNKVRIASGLPVGAYGVRLPDFHARHHSREFR
jgi:HD-GYP domain-containing protein (c-di-GMP phosphodiesterase class II)